MCYTQETVYLRWKWFKTENIMLKKRFQLVYWTEVNKTGHDPSLHFKELWAHYLAYKSTTDSQI